MHTTRGHPRAQRTAEKHPPRPRALPGPRLALVGHPPFPRGAAPMAASPHVPFFDPQSPVFRAHEGGKLGVHATQAAAGPRGPGPAVHPRRRRGLARDRRRPQPVDPLHRARQHRCRHQRRHGGARSGRHRPARGVAGDGGQGGAVQALRRHRRRAGRHGDRHRRGAGRGDRPHRAVVRRHQPRGHLGAAVLRHRGAAQGAPRHPGVPRRPARHGDRGARRAAQRREGARPTTCRTCGWWSPGPGRPGSP